MCKFALRINNLLNERIYEEDIFHVVDGCVVSLFGLGRQSDRETEVGYWSRS